MIQKSKIRNCHIRTLNQIKKLKRMKALRCIIKMATGVGKTVASMLVIKYIEKKIPKILYIVHTKDIAYQTQEEYEDFFKEEIGFIGDSKYNIKQITVSIINSMYRIYNKFDRNEFDYIFIDEAHRSVCKMYKTITNYFIPKMVIGMTATAERSDFKDVHGQFDNNVAINVTMSEAIMKKWITPFKYIFLEDNVDYSNIYWDGKQYKQKDLDRLLIINKRNEMIIKEFNKYFGKTKTAIGYCCSIKHAENMAEHFNKQGIKSIYLIGTHSSDFRKKVKELFKRKKYRVVFTVNIYNEGVNIPNVNGGLMLRPTWSYLLWKQQIGRTLRKYNGKKESIILDFVSNQECLLNVIQYLEKEENKNKNKDNNNLNENKIMKSDKLIYNMNYKNKIIFTPKSLKRIREAIKYRDEKAEALNRLESDKLKNIYIKLANFLKSY